MAGVAPAVTTRADGEVILRPKRQAIALEQARMVAAPERPRCVRRPQYYSVKTSQSVR